MKHLSMRVAWHDNQWNGTTCHNPLKNTFCLDLPRIYEEKNEKEEIPDQPWWDENIKLPPCKAESGAFMNAKPYVRKFRHIYRDLVKANHSHLDEAIVTIPPYSTFAVPFRWALMKNQQEIDAEYPGLARYERAPFPSAWVYNSERQKDILHTFFNFLSDKEGSNSLVFFYTKHGNPIDENSPRLIVGIGEIVKISEILHYPQNRPGPDYPIWERLISHSIRPGQARGFLVPYHDYLAAENEMNIEAKLNEIKVTLFEPGEDGRIIDEFSYGSELVSDLKALTVLNKLRKVIEIIKSHGIAKGPWDERLKWINEKIGQVKEQIGPFPSFGDALKAFGFNFGHFLSMDLYKDGLCHPKDNPWLIWEKIINGEKILTNKIYSASFPDYSELWKRMPGLSKDLLILLSRFELDGQQISGWFDSQSKIRKGLELTNEEIIANPYLIAEEDLGDSGHLPVSVETIDMGLFEDKAIQGEFVPQYPAKINSEIDKRRIRALIIQILRQAAEEGDTLLSSVELRQRLEKLTLTRSTQIPESYILTNSEFIGEKCTYISPESTDALQLKIYTEIEDYLRKIFIARALRELPELEEDWKSLIIETIKSAGVKFDHQIKKHADALLDQVEALKRITVRKLSILHGPAGTGKTSVLGALFRSQALRRQGILLLAPTGKARVRLSKMANSEAYTIAQFLTRQNRFDWERMIPLFTGKTKYAAERTVIIDECSMLTIADFYAVFSALDLGHVQRIILVGDPFQLPPIGPGKPFSDLCAYLDNPSNLKETEKLASTAHARLNVVVRTTTKGDSDILKLATWFCGIKPSKDADEIFTRIESNDKLNDLKISFWHTAEEVTEKLHRILVDDLSLDESSVVKSFNSLLGYQNERFPISNPDVVEGFQILSPVRNPIWGIHNLNRFIQKNYRKWPGIYEKPIGDQRIWIGDKVIQLTNEKRKVYVSGHQEENQQLSNGQIGLVVSSYKGYYNVCFSGYPEGTFGYNIRDFNEDSAKIELAYAITVHKSQGSDFDTVIVVIPRKGRILSRELIYTALTRAKGKLILLVEGESFNWLFNYTKLDTSDCARRNSHLFFTSVRNGIGAIPYAENLIHKTEKENLFVRSKSEVIIANMLFREGIDFEYEKLFEGEITGEKRLPDFTFVDAAGDIIILEHLGMLDKPSYFEDWNRKLEFYKRNNIRLNEQLFTTMEDSNGAINSDEIKGVIYKIKSML